MPSDDLAIDIDAAQFSRTLRNAILLPVGVILVTALALVLLGFEFLQAMKNSDHSSDVELQTQQCEKAVLEVETDVLGFLVHGNPSFLNPYHVALGQADVNFGKLKVLVAGSHNLTDLTNQLEQAEDSWLAHAQISVDQRRQGKMPDEDWTKMGQLLREKVNDRFDAFTAEEAQIRDARHRDLRQMKLVLALAGTALVILLALAVGQLVRRQFSMLAQSYRAALSIVHQRHIALVRSEADLEQQKEWFRVTLTSIGDGVIVTDREGRVVFMNHEAERLTGWSSVEALLNPVRNIFRLVDEKTREKLENPVDQIFQQNKVVGSKQAVVIGRSGQEWPIEDSAAPILGAKGEMLGVVLVFHNATEIRQAQNALREHSDELELKVNERTATLRQAVSDLEAFSYTVSHDLRSPLRAMQGFAQAVLEDYGDKLEDEGRDYLMRIKNAGERLDRLIQDLLTFTRLSRRDAPLVDLDLEKLIRDITEHYPNLQPAAADVRIQGKFPHVWGQEAALTQVISNLLGNAAKFVPPGTLPKIRVWCEDQGDRTRLWIEDNGIGIEAKDAERIFSMFVRVNESQLYGGTGVGLAIVKKAVETMHGTVGVEPGEKGGSKFWVELGRVGR